MSSDGSTTGLWADGEHRFRLAIGQLRELQDKCNAGPPEIFDRLLNRRWKVDDIRETIRLGLIGGGMAPTDALVLVIRYVDERPLMENVGVAIQILGAAMVGDETDPLGKGQLGEPLQGTDGSSSPSSMASEPSSDGHPGRLTN